MGILSHIINKMLEVNRMNCYMCDRDRHESVLVCTPINGVYKAIDMDLAYSQTEENNFICLECLAAEYNNVQASDIG